MRDVMRKAENLEHGKNKEPTSKMVEAAGGGRVRGVEDKNSIVAFAIVE